jgi:hypothetical protein
VNVTRRDVRLVDRELARQRLERLVRAPTRTKIAERDVRREHVRVAWLDTVLAQRARHVNVKMLEPRCIEQRDERSRRFTVLLGAIEVPPALDLRFDRLGALADTAERCQRGVNFLRRMVLERLLRVDQRDVVDFLVLVGLRDHAALHLGELRGDVVRHPHVNEKSLRICVDLRGLLAISEDLRQRHGQGHGGHGEIIGSAAYPYDVPSQIACFWLEPTRLIQISFRRYSRDGAPPCTVVRPPYPGHPPVTWDYHSAEIILEVINRADVDDKYNHHDLPTDEEKQDPRWPAACGCGYAFRPEDAWQLNRTGLYLRVGTDQLHTISDAPAGAMYDAWWYGDNRKGPDGKSLVLKTPEGDWWIDGPANNGPGWTRTGTPPLITCTPSIGIGNPQRLHGWLRNGVLEIDSP